MDVYEQQVDLDEAQYYKELNESKAHYQEKINNQINNKMSVKTAKVTRVNQVNEWNGSHGTIFYCQCEMDNGDKIEIGKKKAVQEGWELTYEIVDTQQEYNKAKAAQKENNFSGGFAKTDNTKGIKIGHAITNAVSLQCANGNHPNHSVSVHDSIKEYAKMIYKISEELNNEL